MVGEWKILQFYTFFTDRLFTCAEHGDGSQVRELGGADVELPQGLDVVVDLADTGGDLLDVDRSVLPGEPGLLVADDDGEKGGDGDL